MNFVAIFALLLMMGHAALAENTYAAFVPKYIRPGTPYSIDVELLNYAGTINVEASLRSAKFNSVATAQIGPEARTANMVFDEVPIGYDGSKAFTVVITGTDSVSGSEIFTNETSDIQYQNKYVSMFIQTDKAIYKPGDTIKFRAIVTTPDLLPYTGTVTYILQDPSGNAILKKSNANLTMGVVGSEFKLGRYSTLGEWKVIYAVHAYMESLAVSVEEYKLPKFSVEVKTDQSFLHPGSQTLTGEISATYTFGQPVRGKAFVQLTIDKWWGRNKEPPKMIIQFPEFDGSEPFEFDAASIENTLQWNPKQWSQPLKVTANVTDKNTGESFQETTEVQLNRLKMKVETLAKPEHIKPGLPYVAYLKISQQDGSPLDADDLEDLEMNVEATYNYRYNYRLPWNKQKQRKTETIPVDVGADGLIVFKTTSSADDFNNVNFNVKIPSYPDLRERWAGWSAERFKSPSNTYLQVTTDDTSLNVGDTAKLTISTTETSDSYRISLLARGKVLMNELYSPDSGTVDDQPTYSTFKYSFTVEMEHSPSVYAVVSFVRDDGEFVADTVKINVQAALDNHVTLTATPRRTDAGLPVSITVQAEAGSFVGLRAIDQSVLLLKSGNDITQDKIFEDLEKYGTSGGSRPYPRWGGWWWPWSVGGADVSEVFENSGFIVLSDGIVYKTAPEFSRRPWRGPMFMARGGARTRLGRIRPEIEMAGIIPRSQPALIGRNGGTEPEKKRSYFPESWIWLDDYIRENGSVTFTYNAPDTITTWELSSFAVSDVKGLGVTKENTKVTVFRNFFISLDLPPSIVRGEVLKMKATVFNYFEHSLTATITLTDNDWYDIRPTGTMEGPPGVRTITIPSKDSVTVVFPIEFIKAGNSRINIRAQSELAADVVERTLLVKPEGIPKVISHSSIIDRQSVEEPTTAVNFDVDIPPDAVEGSVYVKFSVSGNILGNALSNLGNLLKMPSGCGEQTMLSFAPDVYISLYLKKVGQLTGEIKQKSEEHIRGGYQNELRYQRDDGSFSAFGSSDRSGSTWLTAFVAKCFIAANELNPDLIQESKIDEAVNFILKQQNPDGTFNEPGRVLHQGMQGGVESAETTAAYMIIALTEGESYDKNEKVEDAVIRATRYLESKIDHIRDIYARSIVGYALSLVESTRAGNVLSIIDSEATTKANVKYWTKEESGAAKCTEREGYCPFDSNKPSTSSIEITAYALLTYLKMGRQNEVMPIVRWLVQQRGAFGGYHSTQDTVMAIQALSTVAGFFSDRELDLDINVAHDEQEDFAVQFELSDENAIVLQMAMLPSVAGNVAVTGSGVGFADVQVTVGYNLPVGPTADEPFVVDVKVRKVDDKVKMEVCSRINEDRTEVIEGTGMYVVTFTLPSGYTVDDKQATKDNPQTKLVEVVGEEVTGYFDELPRGRTICMALELIRYAEVEGVKPKVLKVFDYYSPEKEALRMLALPPDEDCPCCMPDSTDPCCECPGIEPPPPPEPETLSYCEGITFPCPDLVDGLFYDPSSYVAQLVALYPGLMVCRAPQGAGDSRSFEGLPASQLNGINQYIECAGAPHFDSIVRNRDDWTLSIAIYPTELERNRTYTIFSISSESARKPYITFAKRLNTNQYLLKILMHGSLTLVRAIRMRDIRLNRWSVITTRVDGTAVSVFVNGKKKGRMSQRKKKSSKISGAISLRVGRSHVGDEHTRGDFKGLVSNLDVWSSPLTDEQINAHYIYWQSALVVPNPTLNLARVQHVVPDSIRKCFHGSYTAEQLESVTGDLICLGPFTPPVPPPEIQTPPDLEF